MIISLLRTIYKHYISLKRNALYPLYFTFITLKNNKKVYLSNVENVIVVAHPDDEMIFFHQFLLKHKNTLVICLTNGGSRTRSKEFYKSIKFYGVKGIIYNFKDGIDVEWNTDEINKQLLIDIKLIKIKNILSHNQEGEYGHKLHIDCHKIIKHIKNSYYPISKLYTPDINLNLLKENNRLSELELKEKENVFKKTYKSQSKGILNKNLIYYQYMVYEKLMEQ